LGARSLYEGKDVTAEQAVVEIGTGVLLGGGAAKLGQWLGGLGKGSTSVAPQTIAQAELRFGANDLVYGPSARGQLRALAEKAGGRLLTDLPKPPNLTFTQFSLQTLDEAATAGTKIRFDLTNVKDLKGVLAGTGEFADTVTAHELRHIAGNWDKFKGVVSFYRGGAPEATPW